MKKLTSLALALSVIVGAWNTTTVSMAATVSLSSEQCYFERQYFTGGYHLYQVCMTETVNAETIDVEVRYTFIATYYWA